MPRAAAAPAAQTVWATETVAVVNANASSLDEPEVTARAVAAELERHGAPATAVVTQSEEDLHRELRRAVGRRVVLVGGDGTVHAAANAPGDLPELALIPAGRANNIARQLGLPTERREAARVAALSPARALDTLLVEAGGRSRRCVEGISAGLQADARREYEGTNSAQLFSGAAALARALGRYRPYDVLLEVDGRVAYDGRAGQLFLGNLALFGFGFEVNPGARPADGRLEAVVVRAPTRRLALFMLARVYRGNHLRTRHAERHRGSCARLLRPLPLACDGVPLGTATATVRVESGRLRVAAPDRP